MSQSIQAFGKYLLLDKINTGGMAEVFRAKTFGAEGFSRLVAVKRILPQMAEDESFVRMFVDEARIAVQLTHTNIVQIYELGKHDGQLYIAMEYVSGMDLRNLIHDYQQANERLPLNAAVYIISQICEGLDYAHHKTDNAGEPMNIVHRDISPQNILISYDGTVKVTDFGIAKAEDRSSRTQAGMLKGKFGYMSPEQVTGKEIDHRSDLFAVAIVFYEMLTGQRLFVGDSDLATLEKVRAAAFEPPTRYNPDIPPELEEILRKALARDPADRYQRGSELQDAIQSFLIGEGTIFTGKQFGQLLKKRYAEQIGAERKRMEGYAQITAPADYTAQQTGETHSPRKRSETVVLDGAELDGDNTSGGGLSQQAVDKSWEVVGPTSTQGRSRGNNDATSVGTAAALVQNPHAPRNQQPTAAEKHEITERTRRQAAPQAFANEYSEPTSVDDPDGASGRSSRMALFAVIGILVVGALAGAGFWLSRGSATGSLVITSAPTDEAEVYLDGHLIATRTPVTNGSVAVGEHQILIKASGFAEKNYAVEIHAGTPMVIHALLVATEASAVAPAQPGASPQASPQTPPPAPPRIDTHVSPPTPSAPLVAAVPPAPAAVSAPAPVPASKSKAAPATPTGTKTAPTAKAPAAAAQKPTARASKAKDTAATENCTGSDAFISVSVAGTSDCQVRVGSVTLGAAPFFKKAAPHGACTVEVKCPNGKVKRIKKALAAGQHEKIILRADEL